ncbi:MAG TPA: glycosyltransferase [Anaerolineae bacterium]
MPGFSADEEDWCIPVLLNLVRELARRHEVHIFTLRYPPHSGTYEVYGATVHAFGGGTTAGFQRLPLLGWALITILGQAHRHSFDILHGFWADEPGFLAVTAGRLGRIPAMVSLSGGELIGLPDIGYGSQLSRLNRHLIRLALSRAAYVTVGSNYMYRLARPQVGSDRLVLMPLGVDTVLFHPNGKGANPSPLIEGTIKLLHVASLASVKDQITLLRALAMVVRSMPEVHLHITGEGSLRCDLEKLAEAFDVRTFVTFHGVVPHDRLPDYYRAADLCVLSSRHESQAMVILEAAACARATVGTAVGILPDLEQAGRTVPVGDAPALARAIMCLLRHPAKRAAMGHTARSLIENSYSLKDTVAMLQRLYAELAAQ